MADSTQGDLIADLGEMLVQDGALAETEWESFGFAVSLTDEAVTMLGFRFLKDGTVEDIVLENFEEIVDKVIDLHDAMSEEKAPWVQCLLKLSKPEYEMDMILEYDDPDRWRIIGEDADTQAIIEALR